jgi:hypothetical protein
MVKWQGKGVIREKPGDVYRAQKKDSLLHRVPQQHRSTTTNIATGQMNSVLLLWN